MKIAASKHNKSVSKIVIYILLYCLVREINTAEQIKIREAVKRVDDRNFKWVETAVAKHEVYCKRKNPAVPATIQAIFVTAIESFNKILIKTQSSL